MMNAPKPEDRISLLESEITELRRPVNELARKQLWPQFITVEQAAETLQVSPRTIHGWVSEKRSPYHRAGNAMRLLIAEIVQWTAGQWDDKKRLSAV